MLASFHDKDRSHRAVLQMNAACAASHSTPKYYSMHANQIWPQSGERTPPLPDESTDCMRQWAWDRGVENSFQDDGEAEYNTCPYHSMNEQWRLALHKPTELGGSVRTLKWFNDWNQKCAKTKAATTCMHEMRTAWQSSANTNPMYHDSLTVDPQCTKTSDKSHHRDGTGMTVAIAPGELAETQAFEFTMFIGARATRAEAEAVIATLPDVKFWALAWAGNMASDGDPATFFYAFDVPAGAFTRAFVRALLAMLRAAAL
jgi:hypothetical protein